MLDQQHSEIFETAMTGFRTKHLSATKAEEEAFADKLRDRLLVRQQNQAILREEMVLVQEKHAYVLSMAAKVEDQVRDLGANFFYSPAYSLALVQELKGELSRIRLSAISRDVDQNSAVLGKKLASVSRQIKNSRDVTFVLDLEKDENHQLHLVASFSIRNPSDPQDPEIGILIAGERFLSGKRVSVPVSFKDLKYGLLEESDKVQHLFHEWIRTYHRPSADL